MIDRGVERALTDPQSRRQSRDSHWFVRYAVAEATEAIGVPMPFQRAALARRVNLFAPPRPHDDAMRAEMLAHVVMWRTGMGREPYALERDELEGLACAVAPWCDKLVDAGEWDALIELAIATSCARLAEPPNLWPSILSAQRADGSLPVRRKAGSDFDSSYHATLVAVIAARLAEESATRAASKLARSAQAFSAYAD